MNFQLDLSEQGIIPLYRQIYCQLRELILRGLLAAGDQLPTSREMAAQNGVARVTVDTAYEQLRAEGYVVSRVGAGTFVSADLALPGPEVSRVEHSYAPALTSWGEQVSRSGGGENGRPGLSASRPAIDFGFGRSFPHIFPYDIWRRLLARYLSTDDTMLSRYGSAAGFYPLRQAVADYLVQWRSVNCTPEQVVIVSGIQQALDILSRLLLNQRDEILVETPGYAHAFELFRLSGARLTALAADADGFPVEKIPAACRAKMAFVTPSNQFPRGGTMPLARRLALLSWARERDALILEDDYDGELRYDSHPIAALQGLDRDGRVVYLGTFSKVLFPALRLGYVVLPKPLLPLFMRAKGLIDRGAPTLTQAAVTDFMTEGHFERHLRRLRKEYGRRQRVLLKAINRHLGELVEYSPTSAGLHVMLYLPTQYDEANVIRQAAGLGVGVYPGAPYHLEKPARPSILLGFSGLTPAEISAGVERLGQVIH